jgi:A/G-specific adenine glycosylase
MAVLQLPKLVAWVRFPSPAPTSKMSFHQKILKWFDKHGRHDLPWQKNPTPYRVWISEIMLQQTQVSTVIPYFQRFMERFPDVATLALAPLNSVLELWTGLGYYSRARNCHKAAELIHAQYDDLVPNTLEQLLKLPGIGRSTAGAILALSFQKSYPILDGNLKRVLCRHFAIAGWPGIPSVAEQLWTLSTKLTPKHRVHHYTQAMMDLGATLCTRTKPKCPSCPLKNSCQAHQENTVIHYPATKPKTEKPHKKIYMLMLTKEQNQVLLEHRRGTGIWEGLWSFPECPAFKQSAALKQWIQTQWGYAIQSLDLWEPFRHTLTHKYLDIYPIQVELKSSKATHNITQKNSAYYWHSLGTQLNRGISAPVKRLLTNLENNLTQKAK